MTNQNFDLQAALEKLHEEDWLHPDQTALQNMPMEQETEIDKKYQQKSYWIAQFSHLLMDQYQQSSHACARILHQTSHKNITRAVARYPESDFATLKDVQKSLAAYARQQGVKTDG
ncbi:hypothetical protein [Weissella paramesenteroides]|uniref:hypothetical protein n=1 Tax=Weissella paramesenteroides TaxID=1249 RepID=UPI003D36C1CD